MVIYTSANVVLVLLFGIRLKMRDDEHGVTSNVISIIVAIFLKAIITFLFAISYLKWARMYPLYIKYLANN